VVRRGDFSLVGVSPLGFTSVRGPVAIFLQGDPSMPTIDTQFEMAGGGVFVARYLSWREARADRAAKSSISCDPMDESEENFQVNPCVVSVFRCTFEGLHSEAMSSEAQRGHVMHSEAMIMGGGGAISLPGDNTGTLGMRAATIMHVAESAFRGCSAAFGGAIAHIGAHGALLLTDVSFVRNYAAQNLVNPASGNGGAVHKDGGTFNASGCLFVGNSVELREGNLVVGGASIRLLEVRDGWPIHDTKIQPYMPLDSVFTTASGFMTCLDYPCPIGFHCTEANSSLSCIPCRPFDTDETCARKDCQVRSHRRLAQPLGHFFFARSTKRAGISLSETTMRPTLLPERGAEPRVRRREAGLRLLAGGERELRRLEVRLHLLLQPEHR
jgi:hypothetical protein